MAVELHLGMGLAQFPHQPGHLISVKQCDLSDFFVTQSWFMATISFHENTQHSRLGCLPVNTAVALGFAALLQAAMQFG